MKLEIAVRVFAVGVILPWTAITQTTAITKEGSAVKGAGGGAIIGGAKKRSDD